MVDLTIRCQPSGANAADEVQSWLERLVEELDGAPGAVARLSRLHESAPDGGAVPGWLLELQLGVDEPLFDSVIDAVRDMSLLGLRPRVLVPRDAGAHPRSLDPGSAGTSKSRAVHATNRTTPKGDRR
jgi:hypothetical protein